MTNQPARQALREETPARTSLPDSLEGERGGLSAKMMQQERKKDEEE